MFQICAKTPLFSEYNLGYTGIAFDGFHYYLATKGKEKIIKFNKSFQNVKNFSTRRMYTSLCYDNKEECFWAAASGRPSVLFKLNRTFQETDQIRLEPFSGPFSGVSYCPEDNTLLVSIGDKILHIDKSCPANITQVCSCPGGLITGITCLPTGYLYHLINGPQQIRIVAADGFLTEEFDAPQGHIVEQILYCGRQDDGDYFQMLTLKQGCYPHLLEAKMEKNVLDKLCKCNDINCECRNNRLDDGANEGRAEMCDKLYIECTCPPKPPCPPPKPPCPPPKPPCPPPKPPCPPPKPPCPPPKPPCPPPCPPHPPHPPHPPCPPCQPCPTCRGCNEVLESIALVETAIAHILNAEGEKIQKAIASTCCISEILEVNQEVVRTIIYVTNLEQVLYSKLDVLRECYKHPYPVCEADCVLGAPCTLEQECCGC